ncbi:hypothetical protein RvY_07537 [Ramazzottius varieornatus]|uniref:Nerve growth factor-related domain-containing protein n=1 Tax=Ramazzottius varieornatus TaxID=947166 RepID=A0A1D1V2K0_RAMVA|nr:hypothetical protein RvY_07537 [Ramazzottius varieornatus]
MANPVPYRTADLPNPTIRPVWSTGGDTVTPSCQTESAWVKLHHAFNLYKNRVEVLPTFEQNNTLVEQIFNERYCAGESLTTDGAKVEHNHHQISLPINSSQRPEWPAMLGKHKCFGIDTTAYQGYCVTQQSFVYAMVKNQRGEVGWNVIRVRGGCECAVFSDV